MKQRVYVETSVISYLAAAPSRASVFAKAKIEQTLRQLGYEPPLIATPEEILGVQMNKHVTTDNTLTELMAVKDETAARFRSAADYLAHLGLSTQTRAKQSVVARGSPGRVPRAKQTSPGKSRLARAA